MPSEGTVRERFCRAWCAVRMPELDGENPHFHNRYATLASTLNTIREACRAEGIAYSQTLLPSEGGWAMHSKVSGPDGEELAMSVFPIDVPPNPQALGSNLTYIKRQQAQADWGITGDDDDDGEAAAKGVQQGEPPVKEDGLLAEAKQRLWAACKDYGAAHGMDAKAVLEGVQKRPGYAETPEWLSQAAIELEEGAIQ